MELTEREKKKLHDAARAEMIKQAHGIAIADKMIRVSGQRIKLELEGRALDAVYYPWEDGEGTGEGAVNASKGDAAAGDAAAGDAAAKADGKAKRPPLIVGFHGGGFLFGGCALNDAMWVAVVEALKAPVVSVGYRQGADHDWKDSLKDAVDAVHYLAAHAEDFCADAERIIVMGQSAGALLAATVALKFNMDRKGLSPGDGFDDVVADVADAVDAVDAAHAAGGVMESAAHVASAGAKICDCILLYPLLDVATESDAKGEGSLGAPACDIFQELHCNDHNVRNPLVSPIYASREMLEGLPHTIIVTCDYDNLRHEGLRYATMLKEAGVSVAEMRAEGMPHAYFESGFKKPTDFEKQFLGENAQELVESGALHAWSVRTLEFIKENLTT